ncbi:ras GTPase-activating protein 1-like isoform X2 [Dendronephthya gigantea]|uniref:ras GTPase-activating protein 1-like isoform X2 n=1 Tax=Dendronephthya gigantea TaxID=151771 RepID=UPI001069901D|nr:ras GTPase-activating protein 1-like isoform X2 [Dendronephthya gigantea]
MRRAGDTKLSVHACPSKTQSVTVNSGERSKGCGLLVTVTWASCAAGAILRNFFGCRSKLFMTWKSGLAMARRDELWDANRERDSIHVYVECEENDGYEDELDFEEEIPLDLSSLAPTDECWYHGVLDRKTSEERLNNQGKPGSYLVRKSERKHGQYSLSYLGLNGISHFSITALFGDYYIGGRQFEKLRDLIGYYTKYSSLLKDERLEYPVQPPEPVSLSTRMVAKHAYLKPPGTEALSFSPGDVFVIEDIVNISWFWGRLQRTGEQGMIPRAYVVDAPEDLSPHAGKPWFYDNLSKDQANELLMNEGVVGSFLVRPSSGRLGDYSLSVRDDNGISRFLIKKQGLQYLFGGRLFEDLESIIERYKKEFIEQGLSLGNPVARESTPPPTPTSLTGLRDLNVNEDAPTTPTYETPIVDSNVGKIVKSGFLVKKGTSKKWKSMYFILNGEDEQLLFYEHQTRTRPKGMIDLTYSTVYEVHESLFGRPNCFQIAVRFGDTQMFYLCADTSDEANDWIQVIRKFCSKTRWTATQVMASSDVKQLRGLELNIIEAHNLPGSKSHHPYCIVSLNEVRMSRTSVMEGENPVWNEEFKFNDIPEDIVSFTVAICHRNKRSKDQDIASVSVALQILKKGEVVDDWFQLRPSHSRTEAGTLRIKARYMHEMIMPVEEYSGLKEILLKEDVQCVVSLMEVCKDRDTLASRILNVFRHQREHHNLLRRLTEREIENEDNVATLFRGTSAATSLMDQYMKMVAVQYVQYTLRDVVVRIMECKHSCEINPARLGKDENAVSNLTSLIEFLDEALDSIVNSVDKCPELLRYLFGCLQSSVKAKWPDKETLRTRVVSAFLFLRCFCPAIMNPRICNMMSDTPSPMASRTLTMVAKCLQNLANLIEFGAKEPYMIPLNPFIQKNKPRLVNFIDKLSSISVCPPTNEQVTSDLARNLAFLHDKCVTHSQALKELAQNTPPLRNLLNVTENISNKAKVYVSSRVSYAD